MTRRKTSIASVLTVAALAATPSLDGASAQYSGRVGPEEALKNAQTQMQSELAAF
jgi:hypothetical protein